MLHGCNEKAIKAWYWLLRQSCICRTPFWLSLGHSQSQRTCQLNQNETRHHHRKHCSTNIGAFELFISVETLLYSVSIVLPKADISAAASFTASSAIANGFHVTGISGGVPQQQSVLRLSALPVLPPALT